MHIHAYVYSHASVLSELKEPQILAGFRHILKAYTRIDIMSAYKYVRCKYVCVNICLYPGGQISMYEYMKDSPKGHNELTHLPTSAKQRKTGQP